MWPRLTFTRIVLLPPTLPHGRPATRPPARTARTAHALQISKSAADRLAAVNVCVASATAEITALKESGTAPGGLLRSKLSHRQLPSRSEAVYVIVI